MKVFLLLVFIIILSSCSNYNRIQFSSTIKSESFTDEAALNSSLSNNEISSTIVRTESLKSIIKLTSPTDNSQYQEVVLMTEQNVSKLYSELKMNSDMYIANNPVYECDTLFYINGEIKKVRILSMSMSRKIYYSDCLNESDSIYKIKAKGIDRVYFEGYYHDIHPTKKKDEAVNKKRTGWLFIILGFSVFSLGVVLTIFTWAEAIMLIGTLLGVALLTIGAILLILNRINNNNKKNPKFWKRFTIILGSILGLGLGLISAYLLGIN